MTAQSAASESADDQAVRAIHHHMIDAWNAGDGTAFAAPFTDDADFVAFEGTRLKGRREIEAFHRNLFATVLKDTRISGEVRFVRFLTPTLAIMHSSVQVTLQGQTRPSPGRDSMQLTVVCKEGDDWRGEALMNARRITLERQYILDALDALPPEAQAEVVSTLSRFD